MPATPSLAELARELKGEYGHLEPTERAATVAAELRKMRPDTTAVGRQRAAAKAVGVPTPMTARQADALPRRGPSPATRSRARRGARRVFRRARESSLGMLVMQALGLTLLYWLLRSPAAIGQAGDAVARGFAWLADPVPFGSVPPPGDSALR